MKINQKEIRSLLKSFSYAFRGLWFCMKNERNMRIHLTASVFVLSFAFVYDLSRVEYAILLLTMGLVMTLELVNTAIEALVNLDSPSYDHLARIAKDVAAGAVLMCAFAAVGVGIALFAKWNKLCSAFIRIGTSPLLLALFLFLIIFGILFIFYGPRFDKKSEHVKIYHPQKMKKNHSSSAELDDEKVKIYRK